MNTPHRARFIRHTLLLLLPCCVSFAADETQRALVDALVSEGVLTETQATNVLAKVNARLAAEKPAAGEKITAGKDVQALRLFGDLRFRFEDRSYDYWDDPAIEDTQTRYRLRLRLGAEYKFNNGWSATLRLDSGKAANTSNVDFGNNTRRDDFGLNVGLAYFLYETPDFVGPFDRARFWIGKHHLPVYANGIAGFWLCGDITAEGLTQELRVQDAFRDWDVSLRAGQYVQRARQLSLSAGRSAEIDYMVMAQVELTNQANGNGTGNGNGGSPGFKIAPTFLGFVPSDYPGAASGDAFIDTNAPSEANYHDLSSLIIPAEYTFTTGDFTHTIFATFAHNFEGKSRARRFLQPGIAVTDGMSNFYNAGVKVARGPASVTAEYRHIGAGAYTNALGHPDFNVARANARGPALSASYNFTSSLVGTVSYFRSSAIVDHAGGFLAAGGTSSDGLGYRTYETLQVDLMMKF